MRTQKSPTVTRHYCRPKTKVDVVPFYVCVVTPNRCDPRAHGWATLVEYCYRADCDLVRRTNFNGGWRERGRWEPTIP